MTARATWMVVGMACALGASVLWWRTERARPEIELGQRLARTEAELARMQERVERSEERPSTIREIVTRAPAAVTESETTTVAAAQPPRDDVDPVERASETLETEGRDPMW